MNNLNEFTFSYFSKNYQDLRINLAETTIVVRVLPSTDLWQIDCRFGVLILLYIAQFCDLIRILWKLIVNLKIATSF